MLRTNVDKLVTNIGLDEIVSSTTRTVYNISGTGKPIMLTGVG